MTGLNSWVLQQNILRGQLNPTEEVRINIRSGGSDISGNGTTGAPYATLLRALRDVAAIRRSGAYVTFDMTGVTENVTDTIEFGPYISNSPFELDFTPTYFPFFFRAPITLEADLSVQDTIAGGQVLGSVQDPVSGLYTLNTTLNVAANAYQGLQLSDQFGFLVSIASNTAGPNTSFELCTNTDPTTFGYPANIVAPGASINNTNAGGGPAMAIRDQAAFYQFNGIAFTRANASQPGFTVQSAPGRTNFLGCRFDYMEVLGGISALNSPQILSSYITEQMFIQGTALSVFNSYFEPTTGIFFRHVGSGKELANWRETIIDGSTPIGADGAVTSPVDRTNTLALLLENCTVRNGQGDGVFVPPNGFADLENVRIENCNGDGIQVNGGGAFLEDVGGAGNVGIGIALNNGAQMRATGTVTVTGGGGDYQVGGNPVGAYPVPANEVDTFAAAPELCRLFT